MSHRWNPRVLIVFILFALEQTGCEPATTDKGLAQKHCATCHVFPAPELLDKKTWRQGVFPEMAFRMGLDMSKASAATATEMKEILTAIPPEPLLSNHEWNSIQKFYLANAPDSLPTSENLPIPPAELFTAELITLPIPKNSLLTMVRTHPVSSAYFIGTREGKVYQLNSDLNITDIFDLQSAPSDIFFSKDGRIVVTCMGMMDPNDERAGTIVEISRSGRAEVLIDSLKRPVSLETSDLDRDGEPDLLVAEFGNYTGGLQAWSKNHTTYTRHLIHNFPGTRKTIVRDFNQDGLPDILALITQGDEKIALFTNRGDFRFSYQILLRFPPVYGSSYFELADFNGDGHEDILYTNGDNADYSPILKPYHGVRIFLNDGKNHFSESWFHPMHGASMARAHDFDQDGDLDIAAISFFPDFQHAPQQSFLYFRNDDGDFTAFETPAAASSRWITMEIADLDNDNDTDIILGALNFPTGVPDSLYEQWTRKPTSLLVLKNRMR